MKIHLDKIGPNGFVLQDALTKAWLDETLGANSPISAVGDGSINAQIFRLENNVQVHGTVTAKLLTACSRCIEEIPLQIKAPLDIIIFPKGGLPDAATNGELSEEDLGVATYENQEVDLDNIIHDGLFLEIPMNPICSEKCRGLCSSCGINLNHESCACNTKLKDWRLAALQNIKLN